MHRTLPLLLSLISPLLANSSCPPIDDQQDYNYALNPPLISQECGGWGGRVDYLYWRPFAENNPFAEITSTNTSSRTASPSGFFNLGFKEYNYDFQSGFRLGLDAGLPYNGWRAHLDWTHFLHTVNGSTFTSEPTEVALSTLLNVGTYPFFQGVTVFSQSSVDSAWRIQLDLIDLILNREFYVGQTVTMSPYGGLRALLLRQKIDESNTVVGFSSGSSIQTSTCNGNGVTDFKGVGIVGGLFSSWEFIPHFSFYGDFSASAFYGRSQSSLEGVLTNPGLISASTTSAVATSIQRNLDTVKAMLDVSFGLQWRQYFFDDQMLFTLRAGWEQQVFFRQNTMPSLSFDQIIFNVNLDKPASDITFQGLVVSAVLTY